MATGFMAALWEKGWDDTFAGLFISRLLSVCLKGVGQLAPAAVSLARYFFSGKCFGLKQRFWSHYPLILLGLHGRHVFSIIFKVLKQLSIMQRSQSVQCGILMTVVVECWLSVALRWVIAGPVTLSAPYAICLILIKWPLRVPTASFFHTLGCYQS